MTRRARAVALAVQAVFSGLASAQAPTPRPSVEPVVTTLTIFAGTAETLWRTKDWGSTWEPVTGLNRPEQQRLTDVRVIYPTGPRVYVGGSGGVALSDDFGLTWRRIAESENVYSVLPSRYPQSDPTLFVGTARGLVKTFDDGRTLLPTALSGSTVLRLEWPGPALVMATSSGVFVSSDAGDTLQPGGQGLPAGAQVLSLVVSSYFSMDPVMYVGLKGGAYRSADAGRTWQAAGLQGRDVNDMAWLGPMLYAATDIGLQRSEDNGRTWSAIGPAIKGRINKLLFPLLPDSGAVVFAATDNGIYRSEDAGTNWKFSGMQNQDVIAIATFPAAERLAPRRR